MLDVRELTHVDCVDTILHIEDDSSCSNFMVNIDNFWENENNVNFHLNINVLQKS